MASNYDTVAKFRVDQRLVGALADKARQEGVTRSAIIRAALRRELEEAR